MLTSRNIYPNTSQIFHPKLTMFASAFAFNCPHHSTEGKDLAGCHWEPRHSSCDQL